MFINESRARVAERCLRAYYFAYLHKGHGVALRRHDKRMLWGCLIHAGLAAFYSEQPQAAAVSACLRQELPEFDSLDADTKNYWLDEVERMERILGRYAAFAAVEDRFSVHGVEQVGHVDLGDSCWQCGTKHRVGLLQCSACYAERHQFVFRLDLLVQTEYGIEVWDHKSTESSVDTDYLRRWDYSPQMWGYCYGAEKAMGLPVGRYVVNILRRVRAAEEAPDLTKCCPECKNGVRKRTSCAECNGTGRVERPARPADTPFVRWASPYGEMQRLQFVDGRVRLCNKLTEHTRRLAEGDYTAFPHNPSSVWCSDLCYQRPKTELHSVYVDEERYLTKSPDYVTLKRMAMEEGGG